MLLNNSVFTAFFFLLNLLWLWDDDSIPVLRTAEMESNWCKKKMKDVMLILLIIQDRFGMNEQYL